VAVAVAAAAVVATRAAPDIDLNVWRQPGRSCSAGVFQRRIQ